MAFIGLIMAYLFIALAILGALAFICALCFIISGVIMLAKRRKMKGKGRVKQPWYVVLLRVIGVLTAIPIFAVEVLIFYAQASSFIDKQTNLPKAVMAYDFKQAEKILKIGADPDAKDQNGKTLLMCITDHSAYSTGTYDGYYHCLYSSDPDKADENDIRMMELLLKYGADINVQKDVCDDSSMHEYGDEGWNSIYAGSYHECGDTALILAVRERSPKIVSFLLDNGADVNIANTCGFTPVLICADDRRDNDGGLEIAKILMNAKADLYAVSVYKQDILFLLQRNADEDNDEMAELFRSALGVYY